MSSSVVITKTIWTLRDCQLMPREGEVRLDPNYCSFESSHDLVQDLPITGGLEKSDVAVFLGFCSLSESETVTIGYLVRDFFSRENSGIIVPGELALEYPREYVNRRMYGMWTFLHENGFFLEDFGLPELDDYIRSTKPYWLKHDNNQT